MDSPRNARPYEPPARRRSVLFPRAMLLVSLTAIIAFTDAQAKIRIGWPVDVSLATSHPYQAGSVEKPVVWETLITDPGATYIAVHFAAFSLAPGDRCIISNPDAGEWYVFEGEGLNNGGAFWGTSIVGQSAVVTLESTGGPGGFGLEIDQYARGELPITPESICGGESRKNAKCYQSSHPNEYEKAKTVGKLIIGGTFLCTGSLISCENHFITNEHCLNDQAGVTNTEIRFMFEKNACNGGQDSTGQVVRGNAFLKADATLDYCLMTVTGNPAVTYGHNVLTARAPQLGEQIFFPQHPMGRTKEFGLEDDMSPGGWCQVNDAVRDGNGPGTDFGYYCDSEGGSSGSPIYSRTDLKMIGLHHFGTGSAPCQNNVMNAAVQMANILPGIGSYLPPCSTCDVPAIPTNVQARVSGDNEVRITWDHPGGIGVMFNIYRSLNGCSGPWERVGLAVLNEYTDSTVNGGETYYYRVSATSDCESEKSGCVQVTATGNCIESPVFVGVETLATEGDPFCQVELAWSAGTPLCDTSIVYNVYKSTQATFQPDGTTLVASCLGSTSYIDYDVSNGLTYYYIVRAEDGSGNGTGPCAAGNEDGNLQTLSVAVWGPQVPGDFSDGAESDVGARMVLVDPWRKSLIRTRTGAYAYRVSGSGNNTCASLETPAFAVGPATKLTYSSFLDNLQWGYDGGTVEITVDAGANWEKLVPAAGYPEVFNFFSTACNNGDMFNAGAYTGDMAQWIDDEIDLSPYAGEQAVVRFLFGTNDNIPSTAWYLDDIGLNGIGLPGECAAGFPPPREVSATGSGVPFWLARQGQDILMVFENRPEAVGYNIYQGLLGSWYSHGNAPFRCSPQVANSALAGRLEATTTPGPGDLYYYLVTAWNGDPTDGKEGPAGFDGSGNPRPPAENTCDPVNDF